MTGIIKKTVLVIFFVVLLGAIIFSYFKFYKTDLAKKYNNSGTTHTIVLTSKGFEPNELVIHPGDVVNFKTELGKPFWPASDLHPTHDSYPEFDPKQPVAAEASWSFTFTREGKWSFHDHLSPSKRGSITVQDSVSLKASQDNDCDSNPERVYGKTLA